MSATLREGWTGGGPPAARLRAAWGGRTRAEDAAEWGGEESAAENRSARGPGGHPLLSRLAEIAGRVRLVGCATPVNFAAEVARLVEAWEAGREEMPRFTYGPLRDLSEVRRALGLLAESAEERGD